MSKYSKLYIIWIRSDFPLFCVAMRWMFPSWNNRWYSSWQGDCWHDRRQYIWMHCQRLLHLTNYFYTAGSVKFCEFLTGWFLYVIEIYKGWKCTKPWIRDPCTSVDITGNFPISVYFNFKMSFFFWQNREGIKILWITIFIGMCKMGPLNC